MQLSWLGFGINVKFEMSAIQRMETHPKCIVCCLMQQQQQQQQPVHMVMQA